MAATLEGREPPAHPTHPIDIDAGFDPGARTSGEHAVVDSYHHQAVSDLGEGIRAVAWAPHGVVEAIEMPGASAFVLGVQWELHEEWQDDEAMFGDLARVRLRGRATIARIETPWRHPDDRLGRGDDRRRRRRSASVSFWQAALGYDRLYEREPYVVLGPPPGRRQASRS